MKCPRWENVVCSPSNPSQDSAAPEGGAELSIEKLESQLNTLKTMFAEKQKLVADLEAFGPGGRVISPSGNQANTEAENDQLDQPAMTEEQQPAGVEVSA